MSELEVIDEGFRPNLKKLTTERKQLSVLGRWGMCLDGTPVPTETRFKTALWHGIFSRNQEAPVLVVFVPKDQPLTYFSGEWMVGIATADEVTTASDPLLAYYKSALYSAHGIKDALTLLSVFVPDDHFPEIP